MEHLESFIHLENKKMPPRMSDWSNLRRRKRSFALLPFNFQFKDAMEAFDVGLIVTFCNTNLVFLILLTL